MRVALHHGDVIAHDGGIAGFTPIVAGRLVDAVPTRSVLDVLPNVDLAVILSDSIYQDTVGQGLRGLDPRNYRRVEMVMPKWAGIGWLYVPGYDMSVVPLTEDQTRGG